MIKSHGLCVLFNDLNNSCKVIESLLIDGNELDNNSAIELNKFLLSNPQMKKMSLSCII